MEKKFRILGEFVKDISAETKDVESYIYTKENISKFKLFIDINTKPLKNKMAEVSISTKFKEADENQKNSYFEMVYAVIVKIDEDVNTNYNENKLNYLFLENIHTSGRSSVLPRRPWPGVHPGPLNNTDNWQKLLSNKWLLQLPR